MCHNPQPVKFSRKSRLFSHKRLANVSMTSSGFTNLFLIVLALYTLVQLGLKWRHIHHVDRHRHAVPSEFAESITLAEHQKAASYTIAKSKLAMAMTLWDGLVLLGLTLGGGVGLLDGWCRSVFSPESPYWLVPMATLSTVTTLLSLPWSLLVLIGMKLFGGYASLDLFWHKYLSLGVLSGTALVFAVVLSTALFSMPWSLYSTFGLEQRFGFNKTTVKILTIDVLKSISLGWVFGIPLVTVIIWLMERMGAYWWVYAWAVWVIFGLLIMAIYPHFIAPIFNKFVPLEDVALKARIEGLLKRCGFSSNGVFVMDGSRRSAHSNAYFSGFGRNKRIVFYDTLIEKLSPEQIEAVLAHELGHYRRHHIIKRMVMLYGSAFVFMFVLGLLKQSAWFYEGLGVAQPSTAAALMLFMLVLPVFTFMLDPISSLLSRRHEFEADAYAASQSSAQALISGLVKLYRDNANTVTPDPLHSAVYDSHPPAAIRVAALKKIA
ncbi:M48 family metallopeptidase [Parachitinimonas caeni]|uniref:M48 family metallopeptidase n=1 Tax=Parachitinimonas caeni TaxID=3031301 RepID=A0ABT7DX99_9NEIS|nr:M48 family metallopeptidase [Parachitinimonas caeni]MDK2124693.1 M48 family metallopeptidase [Parachitinimonas caeni]